MDEQKVEYQEKKPKSFYSLNLTEGRIFTIFVTILIFAAALIFFVVLALSKNGNDIQKAENINDINYTTVDDIYNHLEEKELPEENDVIENSYVETITLDNSNKEIANNDLTGDAPNIIIDNSEVIHSSKYKEPKIVKITKKPAPKPISKTYVQKSVAPKKTYNIRYVVQVGSYSDLSTLKQIENFYKNGGYPTYIRTVTKDGKTFYRLRIGPFKEKNRAEKYLVALKESRYGKNSYISEGYF